MPTFAGNMPTLKLTVLVLSAKAVAGPCKGLALAVCTHSHMIHTSACLPAESEVRASVAFQVSRLASLLLRALRSAASRDAWDGLVTGT